MSIHAIKIWAYICKPVLLNSQCLFQHLVLFKKKKITQLLSKKAREVTPMHKQYFTHNEMPVLLYCFSLLITMDLSTYFFSLILIQEELLNLLSVLRPCIWGSQKESTIAECFLWIFYLNMFCVPEWYSDYWKLSLPLVFRSTHRHQVWGGRKGTHPDTFLKSCIIWRCCFL